MRQTRGWKDYYVPSRGSKCPPLPLVRLPTPWLAVNCRENSGLRYLGHDNCGN